MKRITLEELEKKLRPQSYEQLCRAVYEQVDNGSIKPVKASKTNGKKPALYREYWLAAQKADYSAYEEELKYHMCTMISVDYYLRHPEQYEKDRAFVLRLNAYLLQHAEPAEEVSKNERSFEIWGREKFLQLEQGRKILKRCGIDASRLSFYETSEPLAYYSRHRQVPQNLLVLENKDTFYSMRRHLLDGGKTIFGMPVGTLIYGAGKGILRSFQDFSICVEPYMQQPENRIYYFGDLDYEGIGIYEHLAKAAEAGFSRAPAVRYRILPFVEAYEQMITKAGAAPQLPEMKEKQNRRISGRFFRFFPAVTAGRMQDILESGHYIPQEILNISDFRKQTL